VQLLKTRVWVMTWSNDSEERVRVVGMILAAAGCAKRMLLLATKMYGGRLVQR